MKQDKFQKSLSKAILECDDKLDRKDVLIDVFKTYVAKLLEDNVSKNKGRIEAGYFEQMKGFIISEFRKAELGEYQLSEGNYSKLFDDSIQEIFNEAAIAHEGEDKAEIDPNRQFEVNANAYQNEVLKRNNMGEMVTKGGIILPGK